jgi:hypothetical protein
MILIGITAAITFCAAANSRVSIVHQTAQAIRFNAERKLLFGQR